MRDFPGPDYPATRGPPNLDGPYLALSSGSRGVKASNRKIFRAMEIQGGRLFWALLAGALLLAPPALAFTDSEWPTYGHDYGDTRFSPLAQITPANVTALKPAW